MTCTACGFDYCWICGQPMNHWTHKFGAYIFINCSIAPKTLLSWIGFVLLFIIGFLVIPLTYLVMGGMVGFFLGSMKQMQVCCRSLKFRAKCFIRILLIPYFVVCGILGFVICTFIGAILMVILLLPTYFFHIYFFTRTAYWWSRPKTLT